MTVQTYTAEEVREITKGLHRIARGTLAYLADETVVQRAALMLTAHAADLDRRAEGVTEAVRVAGAMLANCALNLAQCDRLTTRERQSLNASRKVWDAAITTMPVAAEPAQPADSGRVTDAMVELARDAYFNAASVKDGVFTDPVAMRAAVEAALAAQGQGATCKACGKPWPEYATDPNPHLCAASPAVVPVAITDAMIEKACKKYAFREDGAIFPDAYSDNEVRAERLLMREFLEHALSASPARVPDERKVPPHILAHARQMVEGHYPSHREYQVADALLKLAAASSAQESQSNG